MFNPLKMNPIEKRMLLGGVISSLSYYGNTTLEYLYPGYPVQLKQKLEEHLPPNGEIISGVAPPALLYVATKLVKSSGTKEKVSDLALGATIHNIPHILAKIGVSALYAEGVKSRPAARMSAPISVTKYSTNSFPTQVTRPTGLSKYVMTS